MIINKSKYVNRASQKGDEKFLKLKVRRCKIHVCLLVIRFKGHGMGGFNYFKQFFSLHMSKICLAFGDPIK